MSRAEKNQTLEELTNREVTKEALDALVKKNARAFETYVEWLWTESVLSAEIKKLKQDSSKSSEFEERGGSLTAAMQAKDKALMEYEETGAQLKEAFLKLGKVPVDGPDIEQ